MSGKDETDLARSKDFLSAEQNASAQPIKSHVDAAHDHSNGDTSPMNGQRPISLDDKNEQTNKVTATTATSEPTTPKPSTPSNWVQFDNEDDSDKVRLKTWTYVKNWTVVWNSLVCECTSISFIWFTGRRARSEKNRNTANKQINKKTS